MNYPTCDNCGRSILVHHIRDYISYCDRPGGDQRGTFQAREINELNRVLGHSISHKARRMELDEMQERFDIHG